MEVYFIPHLSCLVSAVVAVDRYLFNDAEVKPFDPAQIASECFGGEMTVIMFQSKHAVYGSYCILMLILKILDCLLLALKSQLMKKRMILRLPSGRVVDLCFVVISLWV